MLAFLVNEFVTTKIFVECRLTEQIKEFNYLSCKNLSRFVRDCKNKINTLDYRNFKLKMQKDTKLEMCKIMEASRCFMKVIHGLLLNEGKPLQLVEMKFLKAVKV